MAIERSGRGLYGRAEGNEVRSEALRFQERLEDNRVAEGDWEAKMRRAATRGDLKAIARIRDAMVAEAVAAGVNLYLATGRADSTMTRAMYGIRLPV